MRYEKIKPQLDTAEVRDCTEMKFVVPASSDYFTRWEDSFIFLYPPVVFFLLPFLLLLLLLLMLLTTLLLWLVGWLVGWWLLWWWGDDAGGGGGGGVAVDVVRLTTLFLHARVCVSQLCFRLSPGSGCHSAVVRATYHISGTRRYYTRSPVSCSSSNDSAIEPVKFHVQWFFCGS